MRVATCQRLSLKPHAYPGLLVTFCGIDGSGKSSLIEQLELACHATDRRCWRTYTPTPRIREDAVFRTLVDDPCNTASLNGDSYASARRVNVLGLLLSIMGDLVQHLTDSVIPRLECGQVVLCDRYVFTSHAEIVARSHLAETEPVLNVIAKRILQPDLAFGLNVSQDTALQRVLDRNDDQDQPPPKTFFERQVEAYRAVIEVNDLISLDTDCELEDTVKTVLSHFNRVDAARTATVVQCVASQR